MKNLKKAILYENLINGKVKCNLCAHRCIIAPSRRGICGVRENIGGDLYSLVYGKTTALHVDPIEKKPLYHFYPGSKALSLATIGCNFKCSFCQNHDISQASKKDWDGKDEKEILPSQIVALAKKYECRSISYTYTEPTIYFEYAYDIAQLACKEGLANNFVTNGFMTQEALNTISPYLHAANVDLKCFKEETYKNVMGGRLQPVLDTLKLMKKLNIWVEVTTLIIPTVNDSDEELNQIAEFIGGLGREIPWHVSRFHPDYHLLNIPKTPVETIKRAREIGKKAGLRYVYTGNILWDDGEATYCYKCGKALIERTGFSINKNSINKSCCPICQTVIDGIGM